MTSNEMTRDVLPEGTNRFGDRSSIKKAAVIIIVLVIVVAALLLLYRHMTVGRYLVSTNDAYMKADSSLISPKISGYITEVAVGDDQFVHTGQILARIDDRDYKTALDQAQATVQAEDASVKNYDARIAAQQAVIRQADAAVEKALASFEFLKRNDLRRKKMATIGFGSTEQADSADTDTREQSAALTGLRAAAEAARQEVQVLTAARTMALASLQHAQAAKHQAELNLSYTTIVAPIDGTVAARTLRQGQYVQAGTQLLALVPLQSVYVIANYKETQLTDVIPGQEATVSVDTFPDELIHGHVDSIAAASGLEFSLLPPDNATGNFTKIVQRIPVRIVIPADTTLLGRLRPGMSVTVSINTKTRGTTP
ncbi:HlyD family secretion protein [Acetobacter okinawensis]|nr:MULTISPECIES: HlyD family secretion protein [Acetobacteraceae]MBS0966479.1 HlyD family secretion protein [Acetobacter okinawensis]